ncbi:hypothetical protein Ancab_013638 [Ancistrocladus abbreviatus]
MKGSNCLQSSQAFDSPLVVRLFLFQLLPETDGSAQWTAGDFRNILFFEKALLFGKWCCGVVRCGWIGGKGQWLGWRCREETFRGLNVSRWCLYGFDLIFQVILCSNKWVIAITNW